MKPANNGALKISDFEFWPTFGIVVEVFIASENLVKKWLLVNVPSKFSCKKY